MPGIIDRLRRHGHHVPASRPADLEVIDQARKHLGALFSTQFRASAGQSTVKKTLVGVVFDESRLAGSSPFLPQNEGADQGQSEDENFHCLQKCSGCSTYPSFPWQVPFVRVLDCVLLCILEKSCKNAKLRIISRKYIRFMRIRVLLPVVFCSVLLAACGSSPMRSSETIAQRPLPVSEKGNEVAMYALGLIDTGYRFGGKNPEAGLDCSGMVSYIYAKAADLQVRGSAADIARKGRTIDRDALRPGDLVFFNTTNRPYSHVGIYIGDARFVHAPSTNGRVRIDRLSDRYYAQRFEAARTFFD